MNNNIKEVHNLVFKKIDEKKKLNDKFIALKKWLKEIRESKNISKEKLNEIEDAYNKMEHPLKNNDINKRSKTVKTTDKIYKSPIYN